MHFAAQSHVDHSFGNSFVFTEVNILGTHKLLEAAKELGTIKRFIHVSTDEVYGEIAPNLPNASETCILEPTNPYAASKAGAEFVVKSYQRSFNLPTIITRSNNVYGPKQYPEKVIPKFINLLNRRKPCCIHGDGTNTRTFLHVDDVVKAFDHILHYGTISEVYNIGSDFEISIAELANQLIQYFGLSEHTNEYLSFVTDRKFNDRRYAIDSTKLKQLGWQPTINWQQGFKQTIEWYLNNQTYWSDLDPILVAHPIINLKTQI
eukprot:TRINITY_DN2049_c0_g1_i2.p1 TRINITY_DN2049_c0_g1~~TRINITY_DN2049_c0_g1_i2.p1  ORF type:complete len:263 (-),score=120.69 TRINITY_DN2049_c0_g1_i2:36-824(-)